MADSVLPSPQSSYVPGTVLLLVPLLTKGSLGSPVLELLPPPPPPLDTDELPPPLDAPSPSPLEVVPEDVVPVDDVLDEPVDEVVPPVPVPGAGGGGGSDEELDVVVVVEEEVVVDPGAGGGGGKSAYTDIVNKIATKNRTTNIRRNAPLFFMSIWYRLLI